MVLALGGPAASRPKGGIQRYAVVVAQINERLALAFGVALAALGDTAGQRPPFSPGVGRWVSEAPDRDLRRRLARGVSVRSVTPGRAIGQEGQTSFDAARDRRNEVGGEVLG